MSTAEGAPEDLMAREIAEGPAAVAATLEEFEARRADVGRLLATSRRVVVVATGASLAMSHAAAPAWRRALAPEVELVVRQSTEAALGAVDGFAFRASDAIVAVSQSGTSPETLAAARQGRGAGAAMIAVTAHEGSPLAGLASLVIQLRSGEERDASTKSALATLAALVSLAGDLPLGAGPVGGLVARLRLVADGAETVGPIARLLARARSTWFLGFGTALGIAEAGMLLWHEKVIRPATAATPSEFRHGLIESAGQRDAVVLLDVDASDESRSGYLGRLRAEAAALGVALVEVSPDAGRRRQDESSGAPPAGFIHIQGGAPGAAALEALLRVQQLAYATAGAAGTYRDGFSVLRNTVLPASDVFGDPTVVSGEANRLSAL